MYQSVGRTIKHGMCEASLQAVCLSGMPDRLGAMQDYANDYSNGAGIVSSLSTKNGSHVDADGLQCRKTHGT